MTGEQKHFMDVLKNITDEDDLGYIVITKKEVVVTEIDGGNNLRIKLNDFPDPPNLKIGETQKLSSGLILPLHWHILEHLIRSGAEITITDDKVSVLCKPLQAENAIATIKELITSGVKIEVKLYDSDIVYMT